ETLKNCTAILGGTPGKLCLKGRKSERGQNERIEWRAREGGAVKKLHCNFRRNARKAMLEGREIRTGAEWENRMARPRGFDPRTFASGGERSIRLSYGRVSGNRPGSSRANLRWPDAWPGMI